MYDGCAARLARGARLLSCTGRQACQFTNVLCWAQVSAYNAVVASCERLLKQPIPVAYTRHTTRCAQG